MSMPPLPPSDPRHGKRSGYIAGCRLECCSVAHRRYCKQYKLRASRGNGSTTVPYETIERHVDKLLARMSRTALADAAGISSGHLVRILREKPRVHQSTARRILEVTDDKVSGSKYVTALGAMRRIQSLHALGYSLQRIDTMIGGYGKQNLDKLSRGQRTQITATWDRRIRAVWDELSMTLPVAATHYEQAGITKSLARSKARGWLPPLAWDDIDDPKEQPRPSRVCSDDVDEAVVLRVLNGEYGLSTTRAEKDEILRRWVARGGTKRDLCARLGWKEGRYGRPGVAA